MFFQSIFQTQDKPGITVFLATVSIIVVLVISSPARADIILENDLLAAQIDTISGRLERMISKKTGWIIQDRPELAHSFRMLVPTATKRYNPVFGDKQKIAEISFDEDEKKITLIWRNLQSEYGGQLDIDFTGTIRLTNSGLEFTASIDNRSPYTIEAVYWPCIGDLTVPPGSDKLFQLGIMYGGMQQWQLYPKFDNQPGYFATDNPLQMMDTPYTPFSLIDSGTEGLYVGYQDTTAAQLVQFTAELKPGYVSQEFWESGVNPTEKEISGLPVHLQFAPIHFPFVHPGESGHLHPIVLQPYVGTWHHGADIYKAWRTTWFKGPKKPEWFDQVHSWQQIHMNNPEDDIRYSYNDLIVQGDDCARHSVRALQITGWTLGGQDEGNPSHDIDPRLGSEEELKSALSHLRQIGVEPILFTKFTWADRTTNWYKSELIKYTTKDPFGDPHYYSGYQYQTPTQLSDINTHRFSPMCHLAAAWRRIADAEFTKTINLGATGMLFDENQHHGTVHYCFDASHGHAVPAHIFAGDADLAEGFHNISENLAPDYLYAGEGNYDLEFRHYHLSYFRIDLNHVPLHRYVAPDEEMMIAVSGYNDRNMINLAALYRYIISYEPRNFKGRLDEFPLTLEYGKKVDALRKQLAEYLWHGEFRHTIGATVTCGEEEYGNYAVFINHKNGKRAVVVTNLSYDESRRVAVSLNKPYTFDKYTPEYPAPVSSDGIEELPPNSLLVLVEK